jgi:peptidoglycan hydrolase-like protein with peptidoglycan-binding domain
LIGGAVGGATGALTTPSQVNLGRPAWRGSSASHSGGGRGDPTVREIQAGLQRLGYHPGPADGRMGRRTASAIQRYEQDDGLPTDGQPSQAVLGSIRSKTG